MSTPHIQHIPKQIKRAYKVPCVLKLKSDTSTSFASVSFSSLFSVILFLYHQPFHVCCTQAAWPSILSPLQYMSKPTEAHLQAAYRLLRYLKKSPICEYRALAFTTCEVQWILYLLKDFGVSHDTPAFVYTDSKSAFCIAQNPVLHEKTKHIQIDYHFTREKLQDGTIHIIHIPTAHVADIFTEPLGLDLFSLFSSKMHLMNIHVHLEGYQEKQD